MNYAFDVAIAGSRVYIAAAGAGLLVVDVSDPAHLVEIGFLDTPGYAYGVAVAGNTVYVADGWEGLRIVNVADPAHPAEVSSYRTPGWAFGVAVSDTRAYVADAFKGLRVLDVSDTVHPREVGGYEAARGHAGKVALAGNVAYIADRNWGLRAILVSDPNVPAQVGFYGPLGFAHRVSLAGNYAYVAAGNYGLRIVDVSDPHHPRQVGGFDTQGYAINAEAVGHYAFVCNQLGVGALYVLDVSDPTRPFQVAIFENATGSDYRDMAVAGGVAYLANGHGLQLVDVSNPFAPVEIGFVRLVDEDLLLSVAVGVAVEGPLAYVADSDAGLKVVDVSNPHNPTSLGVCQWPGAFSWGVVVAGGKAYVADAGGGLVVVDVSDPARPTWLAALDTPGFARGVALGQDYVYVADGTGGITVVDVSVAARPQLAAYHNTTGYSWGVAVRDNHIYVADWDGGLLVFEQAATGTSSSSHSTNLNSAPSQTTEHRWAPPLGEESGLAHRLPGQARGAGMPEAVSTVPASAPVALGVLPHLAVEPPRVTASRLVTSTADAGPGTLRWHLERALPGDTIRFDVALFPPTRPATITVHSDLPPITQGGITIDASNAGVILDGQHLSCCHGLKIESDNNTVMGLQIVRFPADGIQIGAAASQNRIGGNRTRGAGPLGEGNLLSGNGGCGLSINGVGSSGNVVLGNLIGTDATGTVPFGNSSHGVSIGGGAAQNQIGGTDSGERNIISSNGHFGIGIGDAPNTRVIGNYIGTDIHGTCALGNHWVGIQVNGGYARIGGSGLGEGNVVSGNWVGINLIGYDAIGNVVEGNYVGLDATGTKALSNVDCGIVMEMGASRNLVKGNVSITTGRYALLIGDSGSSYNTIVGNLIGTDASGQAQLGTGPFGVKVGAASYNRIGGTAPGDANTIAGSITVISEGATGVLVLGNLIGTDASGTRGIVTAGEGVGVVIAGRRVFVGGTTHAEGNVISGNPSGGIWLDWDVQDTFIAGNYIGTGSGGTGAIGNGENGITLGGEHVFIQGNTIAHSGANGVYVAGGSANPIRRNAIHDNVGRGIALSEDAGYSLTPPVLLSVDPNSVSGMASANAVVEVYSDNADEGRTYEGSTIADANGSFTFSKPTGLTGPRITATATDQEGNTSELSAPALLFLPHTLVVTNALDSGPGSLRQAMEDAISGDGIVFDRAAFPPTRPVTITLASALPALNKGYIALDASDAGVILDGSNTPANTNGIQIASDGNVICGLQIVRFPGNGVAIAHGAKRNVIGGDRTIGTGPMGQGNLISGNGGGVWLCCSDVVSNTVIGNFIGTDVTGRVAFGNRDDGVFIHGAQQNLVGGRTAGEGNVISGNGRWGVNLWGMGVMSNTVIGNYIGTNAIGTAAIGNTQHGVVIGDSAEGNLIGGIGTGEGNLISGNEGDGVSVENSHRNIVAGNYIGMDASGVSTLGNRGAGVSIHDGSQHNMVGPGNMIAYNADAGIPINGATTLSNTITANAIHSHSGKGIVLANGGNNMLPAPVITTVTATAVSGTACPGCTVEVFSDAEDEGRIYEGSAVANAAGAFTFAKPAGLTGPFVTATATDQDGNTSEFSAAQRVSRKQIYLPMILKGQ
jgi:parallel beta-helix repeat protein